MTILNTLDKVSRSGYMRAVEFLGEDWMNAGIRRGMAFLRGDNTVAGNTSSRPAPKVQKVDDYSDEFVAKIKSAEQRLSGNPVSGDELMAQIRRAMES